MLKKHIFMAYFLCCWQTAGIAAQQPLGGSLRACDALATAGVRGQRLGAHHQVRKPSSGVPRIGTTYAHVVMFCPQPNG